MNTILTLTCKQCNNTFTRLKWQDDNIARHYKKVHGIDRPQGHWFCSKSCATKSHIRKESTKEALRKGHLEKFPLKEFRKALGEAKHNDKQKKRENNLTLEYLRELWEEQNGRCAYTGVSLLLPINTKNYKRTPNSASLDRIDDSKGHIIGNVQWVALSINYAKNGFKEEEFKEFLKTIRN